MESWLDDSTAEFNHELASLRKRSFAAKRSATDSSMDRYVLTKSAKVGATIPCPTCGEKYTKKHACHFFCSAKCGKKFQGVKQRKNSKHQLAQARNVAKIARMDIEELDAMVEAIKAIPLHAMMNCAYCGREFMKAKADQTFCSRTRNHPCRERFRHMRKWIEESTKCDV